MTNVEAALVELVNRIKSTNFTRCHMVADFRGWFDNYLIRHQMTEPDWFQEIQDVDFLDDDADDELIAEILDGDDEFDDSPDIDQLLRDDSDYIDHIHEIRDEVEPDDVNFEGDE